MSAAACPPLLALGCGARRALIAPHIGGAIAAFFDASDDGDIHWLRPATDAALAARNPLGMASFPLLPYCNRIRDARFTFDGRAIDLSGDGNAFDHALHGHAWRRPWRVGESTESSVELHFSHEPSDAPAHHWPFRYEATQRIVLSGDALTVTMSARNLSDRPMPFGMGHHPYYPRTPSTRIYTRVEAMWHATPDLLPTHLGPHACIGELDSPQGMSADEFDLDNNFAGWSRRATIAWPDEARAVTLEADAPFDHMVLYAPAGEPSLLCVEPVTNTVDWINLDAPREQKGGCVLAPGESVSASFAWLPSR
ncbi:aldose 1-epimerase [Caballeronia telluris]|uniref:Aldose 1-epimerase n=1 Tax=Caballeronia telluris TaxID=326475 RepID=A0A158IYA4_9BURK|nr:aldose 1-epimerase [Caballeronia telluris]SAL61060.1 aldose 1-epimerase [Caballeronia telluris]